MKEHNFPFESFISGWYIDKKICDDILKYFYINKSKTSSGYIIKDEKNLPNKKIKESLDLSIPLDEKSDLLREYFLNLNKCIGLYEKKYIHYKKNNKITVTESPNIQYYKKNQGFKVWHFERSGIKNSNRVLVFMTYLNDVADGGTMFKYQKIISPAKKGLTLLWPVDWTHTHKSEISKTSDKFIITGWLSYV